MSVVRDRQTITIFCEGDKESLDVELLKKILCTPTDDSPWNDTTLIIPAGSKFTFPIFVRGYFAPSKKRELLEEKSSKYDKVDSPKHLIFRDRDFDVYPTENIELLKTDRAKGAFLTHRTCIENYLLDADLIHEYWNFKYREKQENPSSKWGHEDSPGIEVIEDWIKSSAEKLTSYQAVRWALADLLQTKEARAQLKTTWTGGSGSLPNSLDSQNCKVAAGHLITQFTQDVSTITQEKFNESLVKYNQQFSADEFWNQKQYLIWFQGKDLQKMMQRQDSQKPSLKKSFCEWAVHHLDLEKYADLMSLRDKIQQLSKN